MNKFDIVEKISLGKLLKALVSEIQTPRQVLERDGVIKGKYHAYSFNWGRNGLYALFKSIPFKTIHFPAFTCPVLTEAALAANKKVILLEVGLDTFNLDFQKLPAKNPECLVAVHTFGNPINIGLLRKRYPKTYIIEDCAHAIFTKINGKPVGSSGDAILFSLYKQTANLNGAILLTKKPLRLEQKEESLTAFWPRIIFKSEGWHHLLINYLRRRYIDTLEDRSFSSERTSSFLVNNLFSLGMDKLTEEREERQRVADWYFEAVNNSPYLQSQRPAEKSNPSFYQFVVRLNPKYASIRDQVVRNLRRKNVFLDRLWYSAPITERRFASFQKKCPEALLLAQSVISLPTNPGLRKKDVISLVKKLEHEIAGLL